MRGTQEVSVKSELKRTQMNTFLPRMTDLSCIDFHKSMQKTGEVLESSFCSAFLSTARSVGRY